jgi:hypothetical protein
MRNKVLNKSIEIKILSSDGINKILENKRISYYLSMPKKYNSSLLSMRKYHSSLQKKLIIDVLKERQYISTDHNGFNSIIC